ncbi:hypothetical protein GDO86_005218 [Hymenochirus boettgeri]|uniref:Uncharacterized protein n=1 Tax=Hymenochirus boettgeri TaxID=247094 RepID=A0A8T2J110_9PIPI|nr:hypothetical protein GDO86_005218 [Hymenochirus boettgeri]
MSLRKNSYGWCRQDMPELIEKYPVPSVERRLPHAIQLHDKKQEKEQCKKQLQAATEAMERIRLRWKELKAKEPDMEELEFRVKKANVEIQQSMKKASKEQALAVQRREKLRALQEELNLLEKKKAEVKQEHDKKHEKFNAFLKEQKATSRDFKGIEDFMNYVYSIKEATTSLQEKEENQKKLKRQLAQSLEQKESSLLNLRTICTDLENRLEHLKNQYLHQELHLTLAEDFSVKKTVRLDRLKRAILDIFQTIAIHGIDTKNSTEEDPVKQLQLIEQNVINLSGVWEKVQNKSVCYIPCNPILSTVPQF